MFFIRIDGDLSSITELQPFLPDRGPLSLLTPHRPISKHWPLTDMPLKMACSLFSLGSAFSLSKYKCSMMEFCNFLYYLQQAHFSTVKPIIIVTENKSEHRGLTGRPCVCACMCTQCKIRDLFLRTCESLAAYCLSAP